CSFRSLASSASGSSPPCRSTPALPLRSAPCWTRRRRPPARRVAGNPGRRRQVLQPRHEILVASLVAGALGLSLAAASPVRPDSGVPAGVPWRGLGDPEATDLVEDEGNHLAVVVVGG